MSPIEDRIKRVMSGVLGTPPAAITADFSNASTPRWDSLGHINLCLALEEEFGASFAADDVVKMTSYSAIAEVIGRLKG